MNYLLLTFVVYFGLGVGSIISSLSVEEIKPGKKYFSKIKDIMFSLSLLIFLESLLKNIAVSATISLIIFISNHFINHNKKSFFMYLFLSIFFYELRNIFINSVVVFIFGIAQASENYLLKKNMIKNMNLQLIKNIHFIIISLCLFYINT